MAVPHRSRFLAYGIAIGLALLATGLTIALHSLALRVWLAFFYLAVCTSTWYGGRRPGLVTVILSLLGVHYFFQTLTPTWQVTPQYLIELGIYAAVMLLVNTLTAELIWARQHLEIVGQQRLKASQLQLQQALAAAQMGIWDWDMQTGQIVWSPEHATLLGLTLDEFDGRYETFEARVHPDDREGVKEAVQEAIRGAGTYQYQYRVIWPDGSLHWVEGRGQVFYNPLGQPIRMSGTMMNIDARKQSDAALQDSKENFRRAIVNAPLPILIHAEDGDVLEVNQAWIEITGYSAEELQTVEDWTERAYGERKRLVQANIDRLHQLDRRVAEGEYTIRTASGETRIWDFSSAPLGRLPDGRSVVISMALDVTIRKQAEADLQKYKDLFHHADHGLAISRGTLGEAALELVNPAFARMHGYTVEEMIGKSVLSLFPSDCQTEAIATIQRLDQIGHLTFESRHIRKDGSTFPIFLNITLVQDEPNSLPYRIVTALDITERKQAELALQDSEERLKLALTSAKAGAWAWDLRTNHHYWSDALFKLLGHEPGSIEPSYEVIYTQLHPDDREYVNQAVTIAIEQRQNMNLEHRFVLPDGTVRWVNAISQAFLNEAEQVERLAGITMDITDRKEMEDARRRSEHLYRTLAQNFPNGAILLFDRDLRYTLAEGMGLAEVGLTKEELEGKTIEQVLSPEICEQLVPVYRAAIAGESTVLEVVWFKQIYRVHIIPIQDTDGTVSGGMVVSQDITVQKQAEQILQEAKVSLEAQVEERTQALTAEIEERQAAEEQLKMVAEELKRSNRELEQFAYVASHDLQEPLRAITSYTQLLAKRYQGHLDEKAEKYIYYVVDGATRMQQLIQDLLTYSRVGRYELTLKPTDCNQVVEQVVKDLRMAIAESHATLTLHPLPTVIADTTQLTQLFTNLLINALKYRSADPPIIEVAATPTEKGWLFSIRDNGIGIEPQYAERIFHIFQRLHTRKEYSGTGLGLAICKKIVERHHGQIWMEPNPERGVTFYFTLLGHNT